MTQSAKMNELFSLDGLASQVLYSVLGVILQFLLLTPKHGQ